ncbi:hypothetical protein WOLCODRAFT_162921 [Wolfiporia cocos MD-104 SS10]|uniref:Structure-specific endonuclease subunit SLX4 n=1 Tax=Wolfiporia cocos (strain MD-104) TaxID=742152 RepID=A0A2H3JTT2_WOLCO|nr:hypothetical protein WOLCODRAFT_162921 [Wolfiporia cocos MD-104 SS10]
MYTFSRKFTVIRTFTTMPPRLATLAQTRRYAIQTLEVISDSEPEREERRQRARQYKKKIHSVHPPSSSFSSNTKIIEIPDSDDTSPSASPVGNASTGEVIDITDGYCDSEIPSQKPSAEDHATGPEAGPSMREDAIVISSSEEILDVDAGTSDTSLPSIHDLLNVKQATTSHRAFKPSSKLSTRKTSYLPSALRGGLSGNESDSDSERNVLKLARFAYVNPTKPSRQSSLASASNLSRVGSVVSVASSNASTRARKATRDVTHPYPFAAEFSNADLARLRTCVGCERTWTTRKTGIEKLKHIKTCARKKALTEDTVTFLIRKELEATPVIDKQDVPAQSKTLLGEVVQDGTRRKGKRKEVVATVKTIAENRENILNRAQTLLNEEYPRHRMKDSLQNEDDDVPLPPPTQAFGESALAKRQNVNGVGIRPIVFPPPTQAFVPSKLAMAYGATDGLKRASPSPGPSHTVCSATLLALDRIDDVQANCSTNDADRTPPTRHRDGGECPSSYNSGSPREDGGFPRTRSPDVWDREQNRTGDVHGQYFDFDLDQENWNNDDAFLHFEPNVDAALRGSDSDTSLSAVSPLNSPKRKRGQKRAPKTASVKAADKKGFTQGEAKAATSSPTQPSTSAKSKSKRKATRRAESPPEGWVSDVEFDNTLREAVLRDRELYLRVLRYEPVHLEVFLQLATEVGLDRGRRRNLMIVKVRQFLDKHAIHFFGAVERTRRVRK